MEIAALNEKITIQKATAATDAIGNHTLVWSDYYTCHTTVGGEDSALNTEKEAAGQTVDHSKASFTVRWCPALDALECTGYRVVFHGELYDIIGVNHQNYKKRSLKLMCQKCRR